MVTVEILMVLMQDYAEPHVLREAVTAAFGRPNYLGYWTYLQRVRKDAHDCVLSGTFGYGGRVRAQIGDAWVLLEWTAAGLRVAGKLLSARTPTEALQLLQRTCGCAANEGEDVVDSDTPGP